MPNFYVVTGPYATPKMRGDTVPWQHRSVYQGAVIAEDDIEPASLKHHLETGLMAPRDEPKVEPEANVEEAAAEAAVDEKPKPTKRAG